MKHKCRVIECKGELLTVKVDGVVQHYLLGRPTPLSAADQDSLKALQFNALTESLVCSNSGPYSVFDCMGDFFKACFTFVSSVLRKITPGIEVLVLKYGGDVFRVKGVEVDVDGEVYVAFSKELLDGPYVEGL